MRFSLNLHVTSSLLSSKVLCTFLEKKKTPNTCSKFHTCKKKQERLCIFIFYFLSGKYETLFPHFFVIAQQPLMGQSRLIEV